MPSSTWWNNALSLSGKSARFLLEIVHPQMPMPARFVRDNVELIHLGNTFIPLQFDVELMEDKEQGQSSARLSMSNIGRELTQWLDVSGGGQGATMRIMQLMVDTPDVIEQEFSFDLRGVRQTMTLISAKLQVEDLVNKPAVVARYLPDTHPGLFSER